MRQKTIALIAHDNKKPDVVRWSKENKTTLSHFSLCWTGTTEKPVAEETGLTVKGYLSGSLGGDLEIGAQVAEKPIDIVFFWDPLQEQPPGGLILQNACAYKRKSAISCYVGDCGEVEKLLSFKTLSFWTNVKNLT